MAAYLSRPYRDLSDTPRIVDFVGSVRPIRLLTEYPSIYDLPEFLSLPANQATTRLWLNEDDHLVGFAYVDAFHTLRFDIDWQTRDDRLENEIITWGTTCLKDTHPFLYATSHQTDSQRIAFLDRNQFARRSGTIIHMACSLAASIPPPRIPAGFHIRSVNGEAEAAAVVALHHAAFGSSYMTTERRLKMMRKHTFDPALDLVAVAAVGTLAAYAMGQVNGQEGIQGVSYADLFATHPSYRGLGLASVLMRTLVRRLQAKGCRIAQLSTDSTNQAMQHVAKAVGFRIVGTTLRFQRQVYEQVDANPSSPVIAAKANK
jgi:mycothiol synthase